MKLSSVSMAQLNALSLDKKWDFLCGDIRDNGENADLAIVLGSYPAICEERAKAAAQLYLADRVKHILVSGGATWDCDGEQICEADLMAKVLREEGVPEDAILYDRESQTTPQNMICSTLTIDKTVKLAKTEKVIIVTSLSHMKRSLALAKALLPRKFQISGCPSYKVPGQSKEEWLADEENLSRLNACISMIKHLVDTRVVEDVEISL